MSIRAFLAAALLFGGCSPATKLSAQSADELREAMNRGNVAEVQAIVARARERLGSRAGEPEVADKYLPVPADARWLTREEAHAGFEPHLAELEKLVIWRVGLDPRTMTFALRAPASLMSGCIAVVRARLAGAERCEKLAREAAEFLLWAQDEAGAGVFPFPNARGTSRARAMEVATRFLARAEKSGHLHKIVRHDWVFDDLGDGGLQFDNGECGVAMFELYEITRDPRHLASARRATDWAMAQPLCANWNYNSFSVWLLAKAAEVTGDAHYRDAAVAKARLGVIPGQLTEGSNAGRWIDAHNARPAYHYIMLRALAQLAAILPAGDDRDEVQRSLALGLRARNGEIVGKGAMTKDKAMETLLLTARLFADDVAFLRESQTTAALDALARLVSAQSRRGQKPLGPREWGLFLAAAASSRPEASEIGDRR